MLMDVLTCVLVARGWKPHFSSKLARTRSGVAIGVYPRAATLCMPQLIKASSSRAAPFRR